MEELNANGLHFDEFQKLRVLVKNGSNRCRWRYWSRVIACCVYHFSKVVFIEQNETFFHPGRVLPFNVVFTSDEA